MEIKNANAWKAKTQAMRKRVKTSATEHVRSQALKVFTFVLKATPQLTGNLAANWYLHLSDADPGRGGYAPAPNPSWPSGKSPYIHFSENMRPITKDYKSPRAMGDTEATSGPLARAKLDLARARWNSRITIVNTATYAEELQDGSAEMYVGPNEWGPLEYRKVNRSVASSISPDLLKGAVWNIKAVVQAKFRYLKV
jgi:hypothetical protein